MVALKLGFEIGFIYLELNWRNICIQLKPNVQVCLSIQMNFISFEAIHKG